MPLALREHQAAHAAEMRELLSGAGHEVTAAASAAAGIQAARNTRPDLVLCAIDEPSSGLDALVTLRTDVAFDSTPIIAVTFHSAPEDVRHLRSVGFDGVIAKPVAKTTFVGKRKDFCIEARKTTDSLLTSPVRLLWLVTACIVPAALLAVALIGYDYYERERARLVSDSLATARAMGAAVDAELTGVRATLLALATSPSLASDDLAAFHAQAASALKDQSFLNIVLIDASDRQLVNTLRPFGDALPTGGNPLELAGMFRAGQPVITDLFVGPVAKKPLIAIGIPVRRDNAVRYALSAGIPPERLSSIVMRERLPAEWIAVIFDTQGTVVARSRDAGRFVGKKGSPGIVQHIREAREDTFEGTTLEGIPVITVFSHAPVSGWTVAIGIPQAVLLKHLWYSIARLALVMFVVLGTTIGLALVIGRSKAV